MSGNDWFNLNSIVDLQKALINDLSGNSSSGNDLSSSSQLAINSVAGNLASLSETISGSSVLPTLTYQNEVNEILERENTRLITRKKEIDVAEMGQKRMVDLTTNSTLRNKALNKMYVVITIAVLMYLGIRLLINSEKVPEKVTDIMFIFLVTGTIILLINMYYDYERRNNMDYNIIDLGDPSQIGANSSSASTNLLESRFNGCVKEACCPEGSKYNDKFSICVPDLPPNDGVTKPEFKYFIASKSWEDPSICGSAQKYLFDDLACAGNTVAGFTTMSATSDFAKPSAPDEFIDYNLYK
jgi:hypothetical protein